MKVQIALSILSAFVASASPVPFTVTSPGVLLSSTVVPDSFSVANANATYTVVYTSTDGVTGELRNTTGTIFLPGGAAPSGGWPVLSWQHGTVGTATKCAPSLVGPDQYSKGAIDGWLGEGYAVVATDYPGLGSAGPHPYVQTKPLAYATLDLLTASLSANYSLANDIVLCGWSEGALVTVAAALYWKPYAPMLNIAAAAGTGTPWLTERTLSWMSTDNLLPSAVVTYVGYILDTASALLNISASDLFTPTGEEFAQKYGDYCVDDLFRVAQTQQTNATTLLQPGATNNTVLLEALAYPPINASSLPLPVFLAIGGADQEVPVNMQLGIAQHMCSNGVDVRFRIYTADDHESCVASSLPDIITFAAAARASASNSTANANSTAADANSTAANATATPNTYGFTDADPVIACKY